MVRCLLKWTATRATAACKLAIAALACCHFLAKAEQVVPLYTGPAPGSENWSLEEFASPSEQGDTIYRNVRSPELRIYLPPPERANGAGVILLPGGALRLLSIGREADDIVRRLNREGVAVFILKYRTLQGKVGETPPRPLSPRVHLHHANANPAPDDPALTTVLDLAIDDARRALSLIRSNAARWQVDPARIGFLGASAGGGVALGATLRRQPGAMPAFIGSLYGPSLMDVAVPADAPPLFMATESNHGPVTEGLVALFSLWKGAGRPAELHLYEVPNFRFPTSLWLDRFVDWMREQKMIPAQAAQRSSPAR